MRRFRGLVFLGLCSLSAVRCGAAEPVDFNREIRPILSNNCFRCHGPDAGERQGGTDGLRLDTEAGAMADLGGYTVIVRGKPAESELVRRISSHDSSEMMPPPDSGKRLSAREIDLLKRWVQEGAVFARHWSYVKPTRPAIPKVQNADWPRSEVDYFILARLEREKLTPSPRADREALIRRLSLDLTGLPPTWAEVERFVNDSQPDAYEQLVDRLLAKEAYGEHWARMWLDLARYADSAGYADDPPRTIWGYRDYVIRAMNSNKPFDQFTLEQIAGDLLPDPTDEQLIATAFHRNTLTNNEGGTNDEEFRNVAVVDRVNTTLAVWMGTTMACAQCHTHKYDPISQEEYFQFFAFFNHTADADRRDESPFLEVYSDEQRKQKTDWQTEIAALEKKLQTPTPELNVAQANWERRLNAPLSWQTLPPQELKSLAGRSMKVLDNGAVLVESSTATDTDTYTVSLPFAKEAKLSALRLEALPHDSLPKKGPGLAEGQFVISRIQASVVPPNGSALSGRYVRIEIPGNEKILSLAEVQVFSGGQNVAVGGQATQSSTASNGPARLAIDGNTNGHYFEAKSTSHTATSANPWWQVDLGSTQSLERLIIWNRTDNNLQSRLNNFRLAVLDEQQQPVWEQTVAAAPNPQAEFSLSGVRGVAFSSVVAGFTQEGFNAADVLKAKDKTHRGWAIGPQVGQPHSLTLMPATPIVVPAESRLVLTIEQQSSLKHHVLGSFQLQATEDPRAAEQVRLPANVLAILQTPEEQRGEPQRAELSRYFLSVAAELEPARKQLAGLQKQLAEQKPHATVPIMRELPTEQHRVTKIQERGDFLIVGKEVNAGVPAAFHPLPEEAPRNRLTLARWLVSEENPLTARVMANRYWEKIFGVGLVETSEDFGSQGELPSHPELLDWLATELVRGGWNTKQLIKVLVTSAAYQQESRVTPEMQQQDPDNRLLARGPRFRMSAEMVRDQALFVSGLLSQKMYGPPVRPPQPNVGLNAAFGGKIDWTTSEGADKYRRGLYTTFRRSNPYPSMTTFDAPNREVCTLRRARTNTPLQALVTLNDPVFVEAAQALGRRMDNSGKTVPEKVQAGFQLCLSRPPHAEELARLVALYETALKRYGTAPELAVKLATDPLGPVPQGADASELAAWTVVGNVLLNLDELLMRR